MPSILPKKSTMNGREIPINLVVLLSVFIFKFMYLLILYFVYMPVMKFY